VASSGHGHSCCLDRSDRSGRPSCFERAQAIDRVGCNPLAIIVTDVDGFSVVDSTELGIPAPAASDSTATRGFGNDGLEILLLVAVSEYDAANEAAVSLGDFSEGFLESAASMTGPITSEPESVTYSGVSPGTTIETLESTVGRYVVVSIVVLSGGPATAAESESVLKSAVALQSNRIPDRCLSDVVDESSSESSSSAESAGRIAGLIVIGGGTIWAAWVLTRRARRSDPAEKWAP